MVPKNRKEKEKGEGLWCQRIERWRRRRKEKAYISFATSNPFVLTNKIWLMWLYFSKKTVMWNSPCNRHECVSVCMSQGCESGYAMSYLTSDNTGTRKENPGSTSSSLLANSHNNQLTVHSNHNQHFISQACSNSVRLFCQKLRCVH